MPASPPVQPKGPAPYDRALALASLVRTMRDHFLEVRCECGHRRVIGLAAMARQRRYAEMTLAHVALTLKCPRCHYGPTEVYLAATNHGLEVPLQIGGDGVWGILLYRREVFLLHLKHLGGNG